MTRKDEEDLRVICARIEGRITAYAARLTAHEELDIIRFAQLDRDLVSHKSRVWQVALLVIGTLIASAAALLGLK